MVSKKDYLLLSGIVFYTNIILLSSANQKYAIQLKPSCQVVTAAKRAQASAAPAFLSTKAEIVTVLLM